MRDELALASFKVSQCSYLLTLPRGVGLSPSFPDQPVVSAQTPPPPVREFMVDAKLLHC